MPRKLASIQRILALDPIPDADQIEVATVLGWKLVVRKGEFFVGDLCVFCEIDSILPERPEFEFLRKSKFRIRTVKLRGQVSQGICFPLSVLPEEADRTEGADVTEALGVTKYEPPIPAQLSGLMEGDRPWYIPKTDEDRIQIMPEVLQRPDTQAPIWSITEKLDGTSCTVFRFQGEFGVCSRKVRLKLDGNDDNTYVRVARGAPEFPDGFAVQGEIIGHGIQGNKYRFSGYAFKVFDVYDLVKAQYLKPADMIEFCSTYGFWTVPCLDSFVTLPRTVDEAVELSKGFSMITPDLPREGIVIRHMEHRVSFKVVNPDFLLKFGE